MHRVSIPRELHVDEISLHVHGKIEHVPLRWSRMNGKELVVFHWPTYQFTTSYRTEGNSRNR